jgi:LPXTG-motif cell wall-anchored protein
METFQYVMYGFYAVLMIAAIGMAAWLYKKRKEGDR